MSWINNPYAIFNLRKTKYNNSVILNEDGVNAMMDGFDSIFDGYVNFTQQISSLQVYPFEILPEELPPGAAGSALTVSDQTRWNVPAYNIDYSNTYLTLGEVYIQPYFNNFADYNGYTRISLFLPLIGYVDLDTNDVMGKWLQVRLSVDYYTGKGLYIVGVSQNSIEQSSVLADTYADADIRILSTYETDIGINIPLGSSNAGEIRRNLALSAVKIATALAVPPTVSPSVATTVTTATKTYNVTGRSKSKGSRMKQIKGGSETTDTVSTTTRTGGQHKYDISDAFVDSIDALNNVKLSGSSDRVNDSGLTTRFSGNIKVIIYRPKLLNINSQYKHLYGEPLGITTHLESVSGYTEISRINFEGAGFETATTNELDEIKDIFLTGVILP